MTRPIPPAVRDAVLTALPDLSGEPWLALSGGRTNRLWRVGRAVIKCHDPGAATPLFPNDAKAEVRALSQLSSSGLAPDLLAVGEGWLAYIHVAGPMWSGDPSPVAQALHKLHGHDPQGYRQLPSGSAAILAQCIAIAGECRGSLPPLPADPGIPASDSPALIHGDAVPGNIVMGDVGPVLIDWQCPAAGDPAEDLAIFLSPAMQWLYRGQLPDAGLVTQTLSAYPDKSVTHRYLALAPLFRWRMAAHCLWKAERGAPDYAQAMRLELQQ